VWYWVGEVDLGIIIIPLPPGLVLISWSRIANNVRVVDILSIGKVFLGSSSVSVIFGIRLDFKAFLPTLSFPTPPFSHPS